MKSFLMFFLGALIAGTATWAYMAKVVIPEVQFEALKPIEVKPKSVEIKQESAQDHLKEIRADHKEEYELIIGWAPEQHVTYSSVAAGTAPASFMHILWEIENQKPHETERLKCVSIKSREDFLKMREAIWKASKQ